MADLSAVIANHKFDYELIYVPVCCCVICSFFADHAERLFTRLHVNTEIAKQNADCRPAG